MRPRGVGRVWFVAAAALALAAGGCANRMHDENQQLHEQNRELQAQLDARRAQGASDEGSAEAVQPAPSAPAQPAPASQPAISRTPPTPPAR